MSEEILHIYEGMLKQAQVDLEKTAILNRVTRGLGEALGVGGHGGFRRGMRELADEAMATDFDPRVLGLADEWQIDPSEAQRIMRMPDFPGRGAGEVAGEAAEAAGDTGGRKGLGPLGVAGLLGLGGAGAAGAYHVGQRRGQEEGQRRKNLAFGAGLATGAVAPKLLGQVGSGLQALGGKMQGALGPSPRAQQRQQLSPQEQAQRARLMQMRQMMMQRGQR